MNKVYLDLFGNHYDMFQNKREMGSNARLKLRNDT